MKKINAPDLPGLRVESASAVLNEPVAVYG
jgi:hypothetical protein